MENNLKELRLEIDKVDEGIVELLAKRMELVQKVKVIKYENKLMYFDKDRYQEILRKRSKKGEELGLSPEYVRQIFNHIHKESLDSMTK